MITLSQRCFKHREIRATCRSKLLHHFYDSVAWNPRWSTCGAAGHVPRSPEGHPNPSVMHCLDRSMVIDWSTGRILRGPFGETCVAQTSHPLRRFTRPSWLLISGLGGVGGHSRNCGAFGQSGPLTIFFLQNCGPVHHNIYVSIGITSDCIST